MSIATLSSKSQIVVPADVRASLGLQPGDQLSIVVEGDHAVLRKQAGSALDALAALVDPARLAGAIEELERNRNEWDRKCAIQVVFEEGQPNSTGERLQPRTLLRALSRQ